VPAGTTVFLFTDADSKDSAAASNVIAAAQSRRVRLAPLLTGTCASLDRAYLRDADETGGQGFLVDEGELGGALHLLASNASGDTVCLASSQGELQSQSRELLVPVDSTVSRITFAATIAQIDSIVLRTPSGSEIGAGSPGVEITELSSGRIISVEVPELGLWDLVLTGSGRYAASANASSSLELQSFGFVELTGRSGHEAFYPIAACHSPAPCRSGWRACSAPSPPPTSRSSIRAAPRSSRWSSDAAIPTRARTSSSAWWCRRRSRSGSW
jgi:hypothetical protein